MKKIFSTILLSTLIACESEPIDQQGPEVKIENPEENQVFKPGDKIKINMEFNDSTGTAVYVVELYSNDDASETFYWLSKEVKIAGVYQKFKHSRTVEIPMEGQNSKKLDTANYTIKVKAIDLKNNISITHRNIKIQKIE